MKMPLFALLSTAAIFFLSLFGCQKEVLWNSFVTTYAGGNDASSLEGRIDTVLFNGPTNLAMDSKGNLYLADRESHRIRRISANGMVSIIAGKGSGFADGIGEKARFDSPRGIAIDAAGNIYIADRDNHRVRRITPQGIVSSIAGNGTAGFADGSGEGTQLNEPVGVAVDHSGNVYVADQKNQRIRKIASNGQVSTVAGGKSGFVDGDGSDARFNDPVDIVTDAAGNIYVADRDNNRIRKVTPDGEVSTIAGSGVAGYADGIGSAAQFNYPRGITCDKEGVLYVADTENNRIRRITPEGEVSTIAGNGVAGFIDGVSDAAQFSFPIGIAVDATGGGLYVADRDNRRIRRIVFR